MKTCPNNCDKVHFLLTAYIKIECQVTLKRIRQEANSENRKYS